MIRTRLSALASGLVPVLGGNRTTARRSMMRTMKRRRAAAPQGPDSGGEEPTSGPAGRVRAAPAVQRLWTSKIRSRPLSFSSCLSRLAVSVGRGAALNGSVSTARKHGPDGLRSATGLPPLCFQPFSCVPRWPWAGRAARLLVAFALAAVVAVACVFAGPLGGLHRAA